MKLKELLSLIEGDDEFIPTITTNDHVIEKLDCRPISVFKVTICPMCEEETWVTFSTSSSLLVPWYECEVQSITPEDDETIQVWLKDSDFLINNYKEDIIYGKTESDAGNGD